MVKGAPVTTEATAIPGAPATTEMQNNSAEVQNYPASASDPVDAEAPAKILIPLEHCINDVTHFWTLSFPLSLSNSRNLSVLPSRFGQSPPP